MSKKLTLLVPAFLTVFVLLASGAATAKQEDPVMMPKDDAQCEGKGMWKAVKSKMKQKFGGMVLTIDTKSVKNKDISGAVRGWYRPGKKEYTPKNDDVFSEDLAGSQLFTINVLVHNPHICWQAGGDWRCVTF